jgi:hypothetical protein
VALEEGSAGGAREADRPSLRVTRRRHAARGEAMRAGAREAGQA